MDAIHAPHPEGGPPPIVRRWSSSRSGGRDGGVAPKALNAAGTPEVRMKRGGPRRNRPSLLPMSLLSSGGPGMGDDLEVKVLPEPGRRDRREAQGVRREAYAERSVKRTRESTNRNRIRGAADRGERTTDREAPATKGKRRRSGDCAGKVIVLTRGGLA